VLATSVFFLSENFAFFDWLQGSTKTYEGKNDLFLGTDSQDSDGFCLAIHLS
jgi:hypothetical protein